MDGVIVFEEDGDDFWIGTCSPAGIANEGCECGEKIVTDGVMQMGCTASSGSVETILLASNFVLSQLSLF